LQYVRRCIGTGVLVLALMHTSGAAGPAMNRGEYLFRIAGCENCHTDQKNKGPSLAGGRALKTDFGTFYTPNITPDRETGIGGWSDGDFLRAVKAGIAPNGDNYYPAFPYSAYAGMRREDVLAIKAYLFSRPAVSIRNRPHELAWYVNRPAVSLWKWRYYSGTRGAENAPGGASPRGAYLVNAVAHCGECHTPRDWFGGPEAALRLGGTVRGPDGERVPNITPHPRFGIGRWTPDELSRYLRTGMEPDGDFADGLMAEVIENGLSFLQEDDRTAIVRYLRSLPAIAHDVSPRKPAREKKNKWE